MAKHRNKPKIQIIAINQKAKPSKTRFLESRKKPGKDLPISRREQRRIARQRPEGVSLKQHRAQKPKRAKPSLPRNIKPLESLSLAKTEIFFIKKLYRTSAMHLQAFTNLLARANAGNINPTVVQLVRKERNAVLKRAVKENSRIQRDSGEKYPWNFLSDKTKAAAKSIEPDMENGDFAKCKQTIIRLAKNLGKSEAMEVAYLFQSMAESAELKLLTGKSAGSKLNWVSVIHRLYSTSGKLYQKAGMTEKSFELQTSAKLMKKRWGF